MKSDCLGDRMKKYEYCTRYYLPRRTFLMVRLDMKSGHTYCRSLTRPMDEGFIDDLNKAAQKLLRHVAGQQFAYIQSDEVSILVTDFETIQTEAWFDNNLQKIVSVTSSILTAEFNKLRLLRNLGKPNFNSVYSEDGDLNLSESFHYYDPGDLQDITSRPLAYFDSRVWVIPERDEVANMFVWRNQDTFKNCISSYAQSKFSHKQLHGKTTEERIQMLHEVGITNIPEHHKWGRIVTKDGVIPAWKFTEDRKRLMDLIPRYE